MPGYGLHHKVTKKRDCGFEIPSVCCSETKILTRFFLQISHVDTWFRELVFRMAQRVRRFHYNAQVWKQNEGW